VNDAGRRICVGIVVFQTGDINRSANHVPAGSRNDGIGLGVYGYAQLVAFAFGDVHLFPLTELTVDAVGLAPGCAVVSGGDDFVMVDDDGAVAATEAGAPPGDFFGDVEIIQVFADAFHGLVLRFFVVIIVAVSSGRLVIGVVDESRYNFVLSF